MLPNNLVNLVPHLRRIWSEIVIRVIPPTMMVSLLIALWYGLIWEFGFTEYVLPAPHNVAVMLLLQKLPMLMTHSMYTLSEAMGGFLIAIAIGVPCAIAIVASPILDRSIMPLLVFSQTFPKAAIAPLLVIWFGFSFLPKVIVAFLIAFFPIVMSMVVGMRAVEADLIDLIRSMKASWLQMFLKVRIPFSLPFLFSGLKTAATFSILGAVVGEWVGADKGLGYLLILANANLDTLLTFAILILLMLYGYLVFAAVDVVERVVIPWHVSMRKEEVQTML